MQAACGLPPSSCSEVEENRYKCKVFTRGSWNSWLCSILHLKWNTEMALFAMYLCRDTKRTLGCLKIQTHRKQHSISFPCILSWGTLLLVLFNVLHVSGEGLYRSQLSCTLSLSTGQVFYVFLQHNFKWTLFYPILKRSWYFYNIGCHITNLFLSWTRSLHHDAVILSVG